MRSLFLFIYRLRYFLSFLALELLAAWFIVTQNSYQGYAFLSSSNMVVGRVYQATSGVTQYFQLGADNLALAEENSRLRAALLAMEKNMPAKDSLSAEYNKYHVVPARVINNSVLFNENYLTLDKGRRHGIERGMGVISPQGIVGRIKEVSEHFSTAYSVLHADVSVSSQLAKTKTLCTTRWIPGNGPVDSRTADILHVPFHVKVAPGDTVETSGYNAVYPEGILIGTVKQVVADTAKNFQTIRVALATDFSNIKHVYVMKDSLKNEQLQLEMK